ENILEQIRSMPETLHKQNFADPKSLAAEIAGKNKPLKIALDYDGTLFPIVRVAATAIPDHDLRQIIRDLALVSDLNIVSGRPMDELRSWFAGIGVKLHAEHGAVSDEEGLRPSVTTAETQTFDRLSAAVHLIAKKFPGTRVERKLFSCCFHYRNAEEHDGLEASEAFKTLVKNEFPMLEVMSGKKAVEARFPHLHKGIVVKRLSEDGIESCLVAIGDDRTDEDMFEAVPETGFSVVVGGHPSHARFRLRDSEDVRALLQELGKILSLAQEPRDSREFPMKQGLR
ncbi:MAG: trehalose-phosphatase, partial [Proteobacteria bacterium]